MNYFKTVHNKLDRNGEIIDIVLLDREKNESEGANKMIDSPSPIFDTVKPGKILAIDELDAKLLI